MNKTIKYAGLVAILSVAWSIAISSDYIGVADAKKADGIAIPIVGIVSVNNYSAESPNTYNAVFQLQAGDSNIEKVEIVVKSDIDAVLTNINGLFAHDTSINSVKIGANDPSSITAEIFKYQIND